VQLPIAMTLSEETMLEVGFIKEHFSLPNHAEAVMLAVNTAALLIYEMNKGSTILVEDRTGLILRLLLRKNENG
jgi:hypothetical protein